MLTVVTNGMGELGYFEIWCQNDTKKPVNIPILAHPELIGLG